MSKFTPGPWRINKESGIRTPIDSGAKHIAMVSYFHNGQENDVSGKEHDANAALISAAPELYEACKLIVETIDLSEMPKTQEEILAAISKADGEVMTDE
jgi:hypothetical protein